MTKPKQLKERFEHKRGSGTGDGKRFDGMNPNEQATIRLRTPADMEAPDTIEGMLYQVLNSKFSIMEQTQQLLDSDGMFQQDEFRQQMMDAISTGNIRGVESLSIFIMLNTMRLRLMENEDNYRAIASIDPKLAAELRDPASPLIIVNDVLLGRDELGQTFHRLVRNGKALPYATIKVDGCKFTVYKVASLL